MIQINLVSDKTELGRKNLLVTILLPFFRTDMDPNGLNLIDAY